jgi:hypothetical protein
MAEIRTIFLLAGVVRPSGRERLTQPWRSGAMDKESPTAPPAPAAADGREPTVVPDYMDRWSRNLRLYETLRGMGLFVSPIPETDDPTKIRYMIVSAELPSLAAEGTSSGQSATTGQGAQRDNSRAGARAAADGEGNVIDFPGAS